jgi:phosphohistidine phosphatase SixA
MSPGRHSAMQHHALGLALVVWSAMLGAAPLTGSALVTALQKGGYALVMRHADAPSAPASVAEAATGNADLERQLNDGGRASAVAMGNALRALRIPLSRIVVSPAFRTRETAGRAGLHPLAVEPELADVSGERDPQAASRRIRWLQEAVATPISDSKNILYITHSPNIMIAFQPQLANCSCGPAMPEPGQMLVLRSGPTVELIGTIGIGSWPALTRGRSSGR